MFSVGCNTDRDAQMARVAGRLREAFPGVRLSDVVVSAAYGQPDGAEPYANMLAEVDTLMSQDEVVDSLKGLEREMGDSAGLRAGGCVMMDLDLLEYDGRRLHAEDWQRPYVRTLLAMLAKVSMVVLMLLACTAAVAQRGPSRQDSDKELLGKAIEYYNGAKYHECILTFEKLTRNYRLSPRFMAYLGYSYYKERQYAEAVEWLRKAIPSLSAYSPREQSVYIYSCAESLFHLERYADSLPYYGQALPLTSGNDRADVLFHTAFAHYFVDGLSAAVDNGDTASLHRDSAMLKNVYALFSEAFVLYRDNSGRATELQTARQRQCQLMIKGFEDLGLPYIRKSKSILPK